MRTITKFLSILTVVTGLAVLTPAITFAASYWKVDMSTPSTQSSRNFNVQYTTLSTNATDAIKVDLYQDGSMIATQTTTKQYGDSGVFAVTVPNEGTHSFYIVATNGSDTQTTPTKQVSVVTPPTVVNTINSGNSSNASSSTGRTDGVLGSAEGGQGSGSSISGSGSNGQTNAAGNSSTNKSNQTLGDSKSSTNDDKKKADEKANNDRKNSIITWSVIGVLAVLALAYGNRSRLAKLFKRSSEE